MTDQDAAFAARQFAETWRRLLTGMPDTYHCELTCAEAETAAGLYRALGDDDTAASIIAAHAVYDVEGDDHYWPGLRPSAMSDGQEPRP